MDTQALSTKLARARGTSSNDDEEESSRLASRLWDTGVSIVTVMSPSFPLAVALSVGSSSAGSSSAGSSSAGSSSAGSSTADSSVGSGSISDILSTSKFNYGCSKTLSVFLSLFKATMIISSGSFPFALFGSFSTSASSSGFLSPTNVNAGSSSYSQSLSQSSSSSMSIWSSLSSLLLFTMSTI